MAYPAPRPSSSTDRCVAELWLEQDPFSPVTYGYAIDKTLHLRRSAVQEIKVLQHPFFGRMLVLDNVVQLTERDEFLYHEMLVHVPLHSHPSPESVLIIGGGDGGALSEVLKHPTVVRVALVEIDPEVIEVSKSFFPGLARSFNAPGVIVHVEDGAEFLRRSQERFDVILVDTPDPVGPAKSLSTREFFAAASRALTEGGLFVMQSESLHFHIDLVNRVQALLRDPFPWVELYGVSLATYAGNWWSFSLASRAPIPRGPVRPPLPNTRFYCDEVHRQCFIPTRVIESFTQATAASRPGRRGRRNAAGLPQA